LTEEQATAKARKKVEEKRRKGDHDGTDPWLRIIVAIGEFGDRHVASLCRKPSPHRAFSWRIFNQHVDSRLHVIGELAETSNQFAATDAVGAEIRISGKEQEAALRAAALCPRRARCLRAGCAVHVCSPLFAVGSHLHAKPRE
jgi:hypothetical protein